MLPSAVLVAPYANGRMYVGQAVDLRPRYAQHKHWPPNRMQQGATACVPFECSFEMSRLGTVMGQTAAKQAQSDFTAHNATGPLNNNPLKGVAASSGSCKGTTSFE